MVGWYRDSGVITRPRRQRRRERHSTFRPSPIAHRPSPRSPSSIAHPPPSIRPPPTVHRPLSLRHIFHCHYLPDSRSMTATLGALKRTPFYEIHRALGAKIVPFAGYEMPVQYPTGITAEHKAVRERCGLFDVSHMGEFIVTGSQAIDFVNHVTTNDVPKLAVGQVHY